MAEKQRPKPPVKEKPKEKEVPQKSAEELRAEKLKRLRQLESKLKDMEQEEKSEKTEDLESKIESEIKKATSGTELTQAEEKAMEAELVKLEQEMKTEAAQKKETKSPYEFLIEEHDWLEKPNYGFMYSIPERDNDFVSWRKEWGKVLLDYAKFNQQHVLYMKMLLTRRPFSKFNDRKKALKHISDELVENDLAKWIDRSFFDKLFGKYEKLRVYWRSIEDWVNTILQWAKDNAMLDLVMIMDVRNSDTKFSNLPEDDLRQVFRKIDIMNRGQMVELEDGKFGIKFKLV